MNGYVTLSLEGYDLLGPGLPAIYTDPNTWLWRVTCSSGAFVREGLELTTHHVETLPHGSLMRVTRKTVNSEGLSRLRVHAVLRTTRKPRLVEGWISEFLNPLSGQRGHIAQPLPFPVPAQYRVTLADGAVVRSGVELSSPQSGHVQPQTIVSIVGRKFSEHPMDQCIERLKLAGDGGWISVRLNRAPPLDELLVEVVGLDSSFDPNSPAVFHLVASQTNGRGGEIDASNGLHRMQMTEGIAIEEFPQGDISSIEDDGRGAGSDLSSSEEYSTTKPPARSNVSSLKSSTPTGSAAATAAAAAVTNRTRAQRLREDKCLICLTEERNATIVHGETGHIACCLVCARILKARGDRCPVCRLPIDSVIQHFWA